MSAEYREVVEGACDELGSQGERVLAFADREVGGCVRACELVVVP